MVTALLPLRGPENAQEPRCWTSGAARTRRHIGGSTVDLNIAEKDAAQRSCPRPLHSVLPAVLTIYA